MLTQGQSGGVQAGELQSVGYPNWWNQTTNKKPGIVYCHGSGSDGDSIVNALNAGEQNLMGRITAYGYPVLCQALGSTTNWGNPTSQARVGSCRSYGQTNYGWPAGKVWLYGISMGALAALNYARANPNNVYGCVLVLGAVDLAYIRNNNISGARVAIETAWGIANPDPLPAGSNPPTDPVVPVPVQYWYVPDDIFTPLANIQNIPNWLPGVDLKPIPGASGHNETSIGLVPDYEVVKFMKKYSS